MGPDTSLFVEAVFLREAAAFGALGGYQILLAKLGTPAMDASHKLIPATAAN
jgi:hypothetical protein